MPRALAIMRTPTTLADGTQIDYGLGTRLGSLEGHRVLGHTGSGGGFRSLLVAFPGDHLTIAVLMNTDNGSPSPLSVAAQIACAALGLAPNTVLDSPVPKDELAALAGVTFDSDERPVETFASGERLHFRIPGTPVEGVLRRLAANAYALDASTEVRFVVHGGGAAWSIVYEGGLLMDAKYRIAPR